MTERMNDKAFDRLQFCQDGFWPAYEEARRARAREAKLEKALREIAVLRPGYSSRCLAIAAAALAEVKK